MNFRDLISIVDKPLMEGREIVQTQIGPQECWVNPPRDIARGMLAKSGFLRGLILGRDIVIWDTDAPHFMVGEAMFGDQSFHTFAAEKEGMNRITADWENTEPDYYYGDYKIYCTDSTTPLLHRWFPPTPR